MPRILVGVYGLVENHISKGLNMTNKIDSAEHLISDEALEKHHETAHELADRLLACIDAFVHEKSADVATLPVVLWATEIPASVCRRLVRDAGMKKDSVTEIRKNASNCALPIYESRATILEDKGLFVVKTDQTVQH